MSPWAQHNVAVYGQELRFTGVVADVTEQTPTDVDALFFDPGRRDERGKRIYSVQHYRPPLAVIDRWQAITPHIGVSNQSGVDYAELPGSAETNSSPSTATCAKRCCGLAACTPEKGVEPPLLTTSGTQSIKWRRLSNSRTRLSRSHNRVRGWSNRTALSSAPTSSKRWRATQRDLN